MLPEEARAGWYIADYSAFLFRAQVTEDSVGTEARLKEIAATATSDKLALF